MKPPDLLGDYYFQQGYRLENGDEIGGCQASSLLMGVRLMSGDKTIQMTTVAKQVGELGLLFSDLGTSDRISYVSVPIASAVMLPNHQVDLSLTNSLEIIATLPNPTIFSEEAHRTYLNMPKIPNLTTEFGVSSKDQAIKIKRSLVAGGIAIPLVDPNTLFQMNGLGDNKFTHAVVVYDYEPGLDTVKIMDPSPGFVRTPGFKSAQENRAPLTIKSGKMSLDTANVVASKYHPLGRVDYEVPFEQLLNSLRYSSTTITPYDAKR